MISKEDLANAMLDLKETQKETSLAIKVSQEKADRTFEEMSERIDKLGAYMGNMGNSHGKVAEEFFVNSLEATLTAGGIVYDDLRKNMHKYKKIDGIKIEGEFDIVLVKDNVGGDVIAIIETKYKAHKNDLDNFINKRYSKFKKLYPEYDNYTHHLGLASFYIDEETKQYALSHNVMILQRKGDIVETTLPAVSALGSG